MGSIAGSLCESAGKRLSARWRLCRQVAHRVDSGFVYEDCDLTQAVRSPVGSPAASLRQSYNLVRLSSLNKPVGSNFDAAGEHADATHSGNKHTRELSHR